MVPPGAAKSEPSPRLLIDEIVERDQVTCRSGPADRVQPFDRAQMFVHICLPYPTAGFTRS